LQDKYDRIFSEDVRVLHRKLEEEIAGRLEEFRKIWKTRDEISILKELFFCILTPQSKATTCWSAVEELECNDLLLNGDYEDILKIVGVVRFKYRKASYILEAREKFYGNGEISLVEILEDLDEPLQAREWLVNEVKGYGLKEASHFLRNIGRGEDISILDRHILKNLVRANVIESIPGSLTKRRYLEIEREMIRYSVHLGIPVSHLDLILWYREAGSIFK
jgi:N-glycosylase/DNA lyase